MTPMSVPTSAYQTLASVAGAPQIVFSCASSLSVVASVVSSTSLNPTLTSVAPVNVSFAGGAASACPAPVKVIASANTRLANGRKSLRDIFSSFLSLIVGTAVDVSQFMHNHLRHLSPQALVRTLHQRNSR